MPKRRNRQKFIVMLLCVAFVFSGPMQPKSAYANLNPDLFGGDDDSGSDSGDSYDDYGDDDEPQGDASSSNDVTSKYQSEIDKINQRQQELETERKQIESNISALESQMEKQLATAQYLDTQIGITRDEISLLQERIALLEVNIAEKEQEIAAKQADIDHSYDTFKTRLRVMQLNDDTTMLGLLLGADSFSDFLKRTETISRIAEHDQELMESLTVQRQELEQAKRNLEEDHKQVEADREETESKKQTLDVQLTAANLAIQDMEQMERQYLANLQKNKAEQDAAAKELDEIYRQIQWEQSAYVGGVMLWPVAGATKITSNYGWRFQGNDLHTGVDLTYPGGGTYGAPILAANDGTVSYVNWNYTPGRGYGIFLIIDHGGGISSMYAHCSNIVVSTGEKVTRGQKVAEVGSTGWSTGPHLHFEVRINGAHTDPMPYISGGG